MPDWGLADCKRPDPAFCFTIAKAPFEPCHAHRQLLRPIRVFAPLEAFFHCEGRETGNTGGNRRRGRAFGRMLKKIALATVLIQVAAVAALITQTVLFASATTSQAANVQPGETVAITQKECGKATWPNIPGHCLKRVQARQLVATIVSTAGQ